MLYFDARPLIKSGDVIGFTHSRSMWRSWYDFKVGIVRMATKSRYSHVGVAWVVADRVLLLEAVTSGVRIYPLSLAGSFDWVARSVWSEAHLTRALDHIGEKYSYVEAMKAPFFPINSTNALWQCAEFVSYVLELGLEHKTPDEVLKLMFEAEARTITYVK